jgi:type IV pilus assembly protein PilW
MVAPVNSLQAKTSLKEEGFTLVELLVAMLIGAVVLTAVMTSFQSQHNTYLTQDQVVEMQQNARVAMSVLKGDIRSAGYDPSGQGAGIITADSDQLVFSRDRDGTLEEIRYQLGNGSNGAAPGLGRASDGSGLVLVTENITHLEFVYLDAGGSPTGALDDIAAIQVSLLAQSAQPARRMTPIRPIYVTPGGDEWQADEGFWSRYLTTTIICRNLAL